MFICSCRPFCSPPAFYRHGLHRLRPVFWMFLLFQLPSLLACYHPVNDAMALHNLPDNVLIYREGWQMKLRPGRHKNQY